MLQQLFTELVVEGAWEEAREVGQLLNDVQVEAAVIAQFQQQRAHRRVNQLHLHLEAADKLEKETRKSIENIILYKNFRIP